MESVISAPFLCCASASDLPATAAAADRDVSPEEYQDLRNRVLRALRPLGTVGPMGEFPIHLPADERERAWAVETSDPTYYILDDQLSERTLYVKVEVESSTSVTLPVLEALWSVVQEQRECGVGVSVPFMRYFYVARAGVWLLDAQGAQVDSLIKAVSLPPVTARPAA
jgi:hypothetical protein